MVAGIADSLTSGGEVRVAEYLPQWLAHVAGRVRPKTLDGYRGLIRLYASPGLGNLLLVELRPLDIQALYSELLGRGLSAGTVVNLHLVLTQALGQAERWGLIARNPVASAQPPRPRRPEPAIVDPEIAERLLAVSTGTRFHLPVAVAISTIPGVPVVWTHLRFVLTALLALWAVGVVLAQALIQVIAILGLSGLALMNWYVLRKRRLALRFAFIPALCLLISIGVSIWYARP